MCVGGVERWHTMRLVVFRFRALATAPRLVTLAHARRRIWPFRRRLSCETAAPAPCRAKSTTLTNYSIHLRLAIGMTSTGLASCVVKIHSLKKRIIKYLYSIKAYGDEPKAIDRLAATRIVIRQIRLRVLSPPRVRYPCDALRMLASRAWRHARHSPLDARIDPPLPPCMYTYPTTVCPASYSCL